MRQKISILTFSCLFFVLGKGHGANYYLSTKSGDDSRTPAQAQNPNTPWKTLTRLNAFSGSLLPGDSVLFHRGEKFYGPLVIVKPGTDSRPIVFSGYGHGDKPVITGFDRLQNWSSAGKGVWTTSCRSKSFINMLTLNEIEQPLGRYPNSTDPAGGYLKIRSSDTSMIIPDAALPGSIDWSGGEIVIRRNRWTIDRNYIRSETGGAINFTVNAQRTTNDNYCFFIQNHPAALDRDGEWYFNQQEAVLGIFWKNGDPGTLDIEASMIDTLITISDVANIVIRNLDLRGSNKSCIQVTRAHGIRISGCDILFSGSDAITLFNDSGISIDSNTIVNTNNDAVRGEGSCSNVSITKNLIRNTGIYPGMGNSGSEAYEAVILKGDNNTIANNEIDSTGYVGIRFYGDFALVKNNYVNYFALVKDDGGGIYTWTGAAHNPTYHSRRILGNIVLNGIGAGDGIDRGGLSADGIYMDDNSSVVEIGDNTVANCSHSGIFIHNSHEIDVHGNTLYNNGTQLLMSHDPVAPHNPIRDVAVTKNKFIAGTKDQFLAFYTTISTDLADFGKIDSNYYYTLTKDNNGIFASENGLFRTYTVQDWQAAYGKDAASKSAAGKTGSYSISKIIGPDLFPNKGFDANIGGVGNFSFQHNSKVEWSNDGKLDGGSLRFDFTSPSQTNTATYVTFKLAPVIAGKTYILRFSLVGAKDNQAIRAFLRQGPAPYHTISNIGYIPIKTSRTENELLFSATSNEENTLLVFELSNANSTFWVDNVDFTEAVVRMASPDEHALFQYNHTASAKNVNVEGSYKDASGKKYAHQLSLDPYATVILIKENAQ